MYKIKVEGAALSKANVKVQDQGLNKAKLRYKIKMEGAEKINIHRRTAEDSCGSNQGQANWQG